MGTQLEPAASHLVYQIYSRKGDIELIFDIVRNKRHAADKSDDTFKILH